MRELRHSITSARCAYQRGRYEGSLADELGVRPAHRRHGGRGWRWVALAALIAVGFYLFRTDDAPVNSPSAPQQAQAPSVPVTPAPDAVPANAPAPVEVADDMSAFGFESLAMNDSTNDSESDSEGTTTEAQSLQFSAPAASISFSNITGWSSVSTSLPALGSVPTLDSTWTNSPSTTLENAS